MGNDSKECEYCESERTREMKNSKTNREWERVKRKHAFDASRVAKLSF